MPKPKCGHLPVSPLRFKPPLSLITSRLGPHSLAKSPSLPLPVRYTAGTASLALFVSLLYILHAIRNRPLSIPLCPTYLDNAYWLCVSRRTFALSHTKRQCNLLSQGQVGRRGFLPGLELGDRGRPDPRPRQLREPSRCSREKPLIWYVISRFSSVPLVIRAIILNGAFSADGNAFVMRADDWSIVGPSARGRDSVRISSQTAYGDSVIVLDLAHMPAGCATWPAFWTLSQKGPWPNGGEIDIIEGMLLVSRLSSDLPTCVLSRVGVNKQEFNQATLHTTSGCQMPSDPMRLQSG
jgi:hypothetical protein